MSTLRKKSLTTTDSSSSSSSGSSSSGSSSCSSSSNSESSSTEEKPTNPTKNVDVNTKTQVTTRRKSSESKAAAKAAETEKHAPSAASVAKSRPANVTQNQRPLRTTTISSEEDITPTKKNIRPAPTNVTNTQRRKPSIIGGGKAPPASAAKQAQPAKSTVLKSSNNVKQSSGHSENGPMKLKSVFSPNLTDDSDKDIVIPPGNNSKSNERKSQNKQAPPASSTVHSATVLNTTRMKQTRAKPQTKRMSVKSVRHKSSEESESESVSVSGDDSTTSSESDASDSSNSFASNRLKAIKGKKAPNTTNHPHSDSDDPNAMESLVTPRKLTRSFNTRRTKLQSKHGGAITDSDSDAVIELDNEKRSLSKSPAKKPASSFGGGVASKCKVKKESGIGGTQQNQRMLSPVQLEKKCSIEGCDSSGHLSGNLDRHFLPEACPIYHNMSASECKERANERKLRDEHRLKSGACGPGTPTNSTDAMNNKSLTPEQRDYLTKIRESRSRFRPLATAINVDKVKLEKDCTDEDREPSLAGLVPDYDMQLFREAQAIASQKIEDELKDLPVGKGIKYITMGKYKMKVWYQSPYPDDAARLPKMYICEFCLRYQKSETGIKRHAKKCIWRHPPGDEIYRKGKLQVWQVDGKRHKQYCQHLCLLAKFFLDHKTLYYDVEPFLFYIMTLADADGCHTVGYFSKEKNSFYNVSCILTLPPYQRKGYGRLLIDFSYLLTRVEGKIGSPEKPLSDLGLISYRSYWKDVLLDYLCNRSGNTLSIKDVSQEMAIYSYDIVSTLQALGMMKYWKGKHIVLKKQDVLDEYEERVKRRGNFPKIDDTCLRWSPFVPTQASITP